MREPTAAQKIYHVDAEKQWELEQIDQALLRREIWFNRDVDDSIIEFLAMQLADLDRVAPVEGQNEAGVTTAQPEPITVYINSYGGSMYDGIAGHDAMVAAKSEITTVALGKAMSAGFHLFMAGTTRHVNRNSVLMAHTPTMMNWGKLPDHKRDVEHVGSLIKRWAAEYARRTNMSTEEWLAILGADGHGHDVYFSAEEAVTRGIAHRIIGAETGL